MNYDYEQIAKDVLSGKFNVKELARQIKTVEEREYERNGTFAPVGRGHLR